MVRVIIQAGHSAAFPPYAPNGGGAPGEAEWAADLARLLAERLRGAGVEVVLVGHWYRLPPPPEATKDASLFVSLHYDAAGIYPQNTGCLAGRASGDPMGAEADRAIRLWEGIYPLATGIPLHRERLNVNITDYYGFRDTTAKTPGILIEHGVGQGLDHAVLFDGIERVADADTRAILAFLGITTQPIVQPPAPPEGEDMATIAELEGIIREYEGQVAALRQEIAGKDSELGALTHDTLAPLQAELTSVKASLAEVQAERDDAAADAEKAQQQVADLESQVATWTEDRLVPLEAELANVKHELAACQQAAHAPPGVTHITLEGAVHFADGTRLLVPLER